MTGVQNQNKTAKKQRHAGIELLRIIAMAMVVSLHFLAKGEVLPKLTGSLGAEGYVAWILESFSIVAMDTYVLISGYFLVNTGFRCKRVLSLIAQVLFYTILIPVVLIGIGALSVSDLTFWDILRDVFPINMLHYWFVSAYVLMFLFTPVLNTAVRNMKKEQLQAAIVILLIMESLTKTIIPVRLELDNLGYDAFWFMCVYLIAAYIRLYGIEKFDSGKWSPALCFGGMVTLTFVWTMCIRMGYLLTGQFENFLESAYGYNHLFTIASAVCLFYTFKGMTIGNSTDLESRISTEKVECDRETKKKPASVGQKSAKFICAVSPYTFGVYLLHEHVNIRYEWPFWLGAGNVNGPLSLLGHWALAIVVVMAVGLIVDYFRSILFGCFGKWFAGKKLDVWLQAVDQRVNGKTE